jgi:hypothetical protein
VAAALQRRAPPGNPSLQAELSQLMNKTKDGSDQSTKPVPPPRRSTEPFRDNREHVNPQGRALENKDGPELQAALLQRSVSPPRGTQQLNGQDAPLTAGLSNTGEAVARTVEVNFAKLSPARKDEAAGKLQVYVKGALLAIASAKVADQPLLRSHLLGCLNKLVMTREQRKEWGGWWGVAYESVQKAEGLKSPAAHLLSRENMTVAGSISNYLDRRSSVYNPNLTAAELGALLSRVLGGIAIHEPACERFELALNLAGHLNDVALAPGAVAHKRQRLQLVTFLATTLQAASNGMDAAAAHNQEFRTALARILAPHQAEVLVREQINARISVALEDKPARVENCRTLAQIIGTSPLAASDRNDYLTALEASFRAKVAMADQTGESKEHVYAQYVEAFRAIQHDISTHMGDWSEPMAYQPVTDAVNKINQDEKARARTRGK